MVMLRYAPRPIPAGTASTVTLLVRDAAPTAIVGELQLAVLAQAAGER